MNELTDQQLLRDYIRNRSETAFAELVRRHIDFVFSAALRLVCDRQSAEDVSQGVFVALAQNAARLEEHPVLSGWLHCTTRNLAAKTVRANVRRTAREQEAAAMNELLAGGSNALWENIAPHLDAALGELPDTDRDALLLRYFERKSAREMAQILGTSEEAAQKRLSRAVERLREFFSKRGITIGAAGLVVVISANAVHAAPAGLAVAVSSAALVAATTIQTSTAIAATKVIAMTTLQKALAGTAIAVLAGTGIYEAHQTTQLHTRIRALQQQQAPLTAQIAQLQQERDDATNRVATLTEELAGARGDNTELLKLRGEVGVLREQLYASQHSQSTGSLESQKMNASTDPAPGDLASQLAAAIVQGSPVALQSMRDLAKSRLDFFSTNRVGLTNEQLAAIQTEAFGGLAAAFNWLSERAVNGNANARQAIGQAAGMKELQGFAITGLGQLAGQGDQNALQMLLNPNQYGFLESSTVDALGPAANNGNQQAIATLAAVLQDPTKKALWNLASLGLQGPAASGNTVALQALKSLSPQQ